MSEFFEIAYAAASNRLCLFTGTGFSKAVSNNKAPGWQGLLDSLCDLLADRDKLRDILFPAGGKSPLSLEEAAQVISIELLKNGKSIHQEVASIIKGLTLEGDNSDISDFLSKHEFSAITTNYDKLLETLCGVAECHSLSPGLPIPRSHARVSVYHVHGSVDSPENMVVTSDDYFRFLNAESYFSRKLSTVLHENTVVILGYSLGDTNLKAIISDYKGFSNNYVVGSNIFFVSKDHIDHHIKDYYSHCYGIRVLDSIEIHEFFEELNEQIPKAQKRADKSINNVTKVLLHGKHFSKDFLKIENSFYEIISSLSAIGRSINDPLVVPILGKIIKTKKGLTGESGAWVQYEHLARWLIYLASILELADTAIEEIYLDAALHSMTTMRRELYIGYSWHAFRSWNNRWLDIIASNRVIIQKYIEDNTSWTDALAVVKRG